MRKILIVALLSIASLARADDASLLTDGGINAFLATMDAFSIRIHDQVTDGCLPQPNALSDKLEVALRKNGFRIVDPSFLTNDIHIIPVGYALTTTSCAVSVVVTLSFATFSNVPYINRPGPNTTILSVERQLTGTLLTGEKASMQSRLEEQMTQTADKLYLDISRARDDIFSKFPEIEANFKANR